MTFVRMTIFRAMGWNAHRSGLRNECNKQVGKAKISLVI